MTSGAGITALRALTAAWEARRVYGCSHDAFRLAVERSASALEDATRGGAAITLAICEDSVIWGDEIVSDRALTTSEFLAHLAAEDCSYLRFSAGVNRQDVEWLLEIGNGSDKRHSPSGKLAVGKLSNTDRGSRRNSFEQSRELLDGADCGGLCVPCDSTADPAPLKTALSSLLAGSQRVPKEVGSMAVNIMSAVLSSRSGLISLVDLKDHDEYTYVHAVNVGLLASSLGQAIGLSNERLAQITEAALLHDVGKRLVPITILSKKSSLSDAERAVMQTHPARGAALLAGVRGVTDLAVVAAFEHHMRIDGGGYPRSPHGRFPSLTSQLIQIADIFDALRSDRPYRAGLPMTECLEIMSRDSGLSFDRDLFSVFRNAVLSRFAVVSAADLQAA